MPGGTRSRTCDHEPLTNIPRALEREGPGTVAAVFVESVVGANGVLIPPPGYMERLRAACDAHGALLVIDEVLAGFGRTGRWFGLNHFGVVPDLVTCGKAITSGYGTLGAVLVHERVSRHFDDHPLVAGLTHYAHPLGVAAALEAIAVYEDEGLVHRAAELEPALVEGLTSASVRANERGGAVRAIGLLGAVELSLDADRWKRLSAALRDRRIHAHVLPRTGALIVSPPLCIGRDELERGLAQVGDAVAEATS